MATPLNLDAINELPTAPAADVKKIGWRGLMKTVAAKGKLVVTNHNQPQAVILSTQEYEAMLAALRQEHARKEAILAELRRRMDEHLAPLKAPDAGERLRAAMHAPTKLDGTVKAGSTF